MRERYIKRERERGNDEGRDRWEGPVSDGYKKDRDEEDGWRERQKDKERERQDKGERGK